MMMATDLIAIRTMVITSQEDLIIWMMKMAAIKCDNYNEDDDNVFKNLLKDSLC